MYRSGTSQTRRVKDITINIKKVSTENNKSQIAMPIAKQSQCVINANFFKNFSII